MQGGKSSAFARVVALQGGWDSRRNAEGVTKNGA